MKYRVKIVYTEEYTTWVAAENEEAAEEAALDQYSNAKIFPDIDRLTTEIIDTDEEDD